LSKYTYGILAYGSLLADPGEEIAAATEGRTRVTTPFPVEYARSSKRRAGAPTLVLVPEGCGAPVQAQILLIRPDMGADAVADFLYRREINRVGEMDVVYNEARQQQKRDPVLVKRVQDLAEVPYVLYTYLKPNLNVVLDNDRTEAEKATHLADLAARSVTAKTYAAGRDGIRYLADAIRHDVQTPLTEAYWQAILRLADDAPDLDEARQRIARQRGIWRKKCDQPAHQCLPCGPAPV